MARLVIESLFQKEKREMKSATIMMLVGVALIGTMIPNAKADEWNQKIIFTFSGPVEIPGQVLSAGTYVFKLADSQSDRSIVQVFNKNENHLYGTFLTIPDYRLKPTGKSVITFDERASGSPEAVKAWFYPGENYGHDFVYPKAKAVALAKANNQPVASMPDERAANTTKPAKTMREPHVVAMKQAPVKAQKPTGEEVEIAEVFLAPPTDSASAPQHLPTTATDPASVPQHLPPTASPLPLIGLIGLLSLAGAVSLRLVSHRIG
jgi:hypothetical protein